MISQNKSKLKLLQGYYKVFNTYYSILENYDEIINNGSFEGKLRTCNNLRKAWINLFSSPFLKEEVTLLDDCLQYSISETAKNRLNIIINFER